VDDAPMLLTALSMVTSSSVSPIVSSGSISASESLCVAFCDSCSLSISACVPASRFARLHVSHLLR
jgi:hypothetical protein